MPVDANGTPSAKLGIYEYNTAGDAPSGKGLNNIVDSLDDIISRLGISGMVANDVPVYDSVAGKWKKAGGSHTGTNFLRDDGTWAPAAPLTYRKTSVKQVINSTAETDLLNGEITLAALSATSVIRVSAWGDWKQFTGANALTPRFRLKLGGTTIFDWQQGSNKVGSANTRFGWRLSSEIINRGATNSQSASFLHHIGWGAGASTTTYDQYLWVGEGETVGIQGASGGHSMDISQGLNTVAVDTSAAQALTLTVQNNQLSTNYDTQLYGAIVEIL